MSLLVWTADFQLSTSRSLDSKHVVVPATCSSFEQILGLSPCGSVSMVERAATVPIRSTMKDPENTRECTVSGFNTFFGKYQSVTNFPHRSKTKYVRLTNQPWSTNLIASLPWCVSYDSQTRSLSQNSRSRVVCHCATQLKLENVESNGHNCGLWKNCQKYGTVHKECWLKQRRNLIMTSPNKKKKTDALTDIV